jgi:hypothetical protein
MKLLLYIYVYFRKQRHPTDSGNKKLRDMKTLKINIHPKLEGVEITVKNGAAFSRAIIEGCFKNFSFTTNEEDLKRIKKFAVKYGNDNNSNRGHWYAHCNGYAMDLIVDYKNNLQINTYRPYGQYGRI